MSDRAFVDTNILVYAHDKAAGKKHERARLLIDELWATRTGVVSTQVLQELCVALRRNAARPLDVRTTREIVMDYLAWDVWVNTGEAVAEALSIEERCQISFWDAMIVHAARAAGTTLLYSEDFSDGRVYEGVRVVNPLRVGS